MKIVRYVLLTIAGLIALAVITLLFLGSRPGADRMTGTVDIARPPRVVFAFVDEPDKLKSWISWLVEVRDETPGQHGVGSRHVLVMEDRNNGNMRMNIAGEVLAYERDKSERLRLSSPGMFSGETVYALTDLGNGQTRLRQESRYRFENWFARLMAPVIFPAARKKMGEDLQRLKAAVEKS